MWVQVRTINEILAERHYLGPIGRGIAWQDELGVLVLTTPTARHIPQHWLELARWCLYGEKNGGSRQWSRVAKALRRSQQHERFTTVVSYSDPSVGHTGALYKACNWSWAPTWHRLRPPPTGNGNWGSGAQSVKDRWIFALRDDPDRDEVLRVKDASAVKRLAAS